MEWESSDKSSVQPRRARAQHLPGSRIQRMAQLGILRTGPKNPKIQGKNTVLSSHTMSQPPLSWQGTGKGCGASSSGGWGIQNTPKMSCPQLNQQKVSENLEFLILKSRKAGEIHQH